MPNETDAVHPNFPTFGPTSLDSSHFALFSETLLRFLLLLLLNCMLPQGWAIRLNLHSRDITP